VAGVTFMERRVPSRLRSTGQTLFNGATFGLGTVLASNLFGVLYDRIHAAGIFLVAAMIAALAAMAVAVVPNNPAETTSASR
jgi:predicted MFS family arabinose efflux permease